jgi:RNA polymerase sigma-70 factor, ECF subfamily
MSSDFSGIYATARAEEDWLAGGEIRRFGQETMRLEQKIISYFEQLRDPVYRYLVAVFGHPELAEELTQEAFLQLHKTLHSGQSITNVRAWVYRVAHNLAVNQMKTRQFTAPLDDEAWEELRRKLADTAPGPDERLLQREKAQRLCAAIARLTLVERECLHLRSKGIRYREMGEILGLSTTTIAETLYRVIEKLARECNE